MRYIRSVGDCRQCLHNADVRKYRHLFALHNRSRTLEIKTKSVRRFTPSSLRVFRLLDIILVSRSAIAFQTSLKRISGDHDMSARGDAWGSGMPLANILCDRVAFMP